ncbi:MAG TPA: patatin family protein [Bacilli bacterium]|nr:patatin family protein [Bacilli bacterium]
MKDVGLVLEGGGMRGIYTAGVLEAFMENNFYVPYVIGVSAGACQGASYLSRQKGRNSRAMLDFIDDPRYLSYKNYLRNRELFGMDLLFDEIPNQLLPFDFKTFHEVQDRFYIGTTDMETGEALYFEKNDFPNETLHFLRASSSLPFIAHPYKFQEKLLLDGGLADPIPIKKSIEDGNRKNIIILTQDPGFRKKRSRLEAIIKRAYRKYPGLLEVMSNRVQLYNETLDFIAAEEERGRAFVIRPQSKLELGSLGKSRSKLIYAYELGITEGRQAYEPLQKWLES